MGFDGYFHNAEVMALKASPFHVLYPGPWPPQGPIQFNYIWIEVNLKSGKGPSLNTAGPDYARSWPGTSPSYTRCSLISLRKKIRNRKTCTRFLDGCWALKRFWLELNWAEYKLQPLIAITLLFLKKQFNGDRTSTSHARWFNTMQKRYTAFPS